MSIVDVFTDVVARAGASDTDRGAWLAERREGVTATEMAGVMKAGNRERAIRDLVVKKRDGDSFTGNAYTEWGREREPIIAADLMWEHGTVAESRVFHAANNSRHLASPDGFTITDGRLVLEEIKTSGKALPLDSAEFVASGYEWQMLWGLYVTDAVGCWLTVEIRHGQPGGFVAGERTRVWVARDEGKIAEMIEVADMVLAAMDSGAVDDVDPTVDADALAYLAGLAWEKDGKTRKEAAYKRLVEAGKSQDSARVRVTFTPGKPATVTEVEEVDEDAARVARPDLLEAVEAARLAWDEHCRSHIIVRTVESRATLGRVTVTAVKGET